MEKANPIEVGHRIRQIRLSLNMTQKEFGEILGDTGGRVKSAVSNWELGRNNPSAKRLNLIANIAGITVDELLHGKQAAKDYLSRFTNEQLLKEIERRLLKNG